MPGMPQSVGHRESDMTEHVWQELFTEINVPSFFLDLQNGFVSQSFWPLGVASQPRTQ